MCNSLGSRKMDYWKSSSTCKVLVPGGFCACLVPHLSWGISNFYCVISCTSVPTSCGRAGGDKGSPATRKRFGESCLTSASSSSSPMMMTIVRAVHRARLYALRARPGIIWPDSFVCVTWKQVDVSYIVTARWRVVLYYISCLKDFVLVLYRLRATCTSCLFRTDFVRNYYYI